MLDDGNSGRRRSYAKGDANAGPHDSLSRPSSTFSTNNNGRAPERQIPTELDHPVHLSRRPTPGLLRTPGARISSWASWDDSSSSCKSNNNSRSSSSLSPSLSCSSSRAPANGAKPLPGGVAARRRGVDGGNGSSGGSGVDGGGSGGSGGSWRTAREEL
ncbi:hypothetical protein PG994_013656 [Apiospora phragmitis]|uniref:Uncharacterized protein n=1 Tax=Apiospora phragmitis TaxID=2905665 RepID=A0ABR1TBV2_9PEZI